MAFQYVRISSSRLMYLDINGIPAYNYCVWPVQAGTSTSVVTYQDKDGIAPNALKIVLDPWGMCQIFTRETIDLIFCSPTSTGPTDGVIRTDPYFEVQTRINDVATADPGTTNNNYTASTTPLYAAPLPQNFSLSLTPDVDSADTIVSQTFSGIGINDAIFTGPYTGTIGSTFTAYIDGSDFQGAGLNDVGWGGTPLDAHVYTAKISTAASPDKFQWQKDGGTWSAEIVITGSAQTLTDGVTITFSAITGHTLADLWNNVNTFKWRKGTGAWTATGVPITATAQSLGTEGIYVTFAQKTGHTLTDYTTVTVATPVRFDFCSTGSIIVYKNVDGSLQALGEKDFVTGIPAHLDYSSSPLCWILLNPKLPVLTSLTPHRPRKELYANYTVIDGDESVVLHCNADLIIDFPALSTLANKDFFIVPGIYTVTIRTVGAVTDGMYPPYSATKVTTYDLYVGGPGAIRIHNNGASLIFMAQIAPPNNYIKTTQFVIPGPPTAALSATAGVVTAGNHTVKISLRNAAGSKTIPSVVSGTVAADGTHAIDLTSVPVGPNGWTIRDYWMNKAGGATWYLAASDTNTGATATINIADASLTQAAHAAAVWVKTPGYNYLENDVIAGGAGGGGSSSTAGGGGGAGGRSKLTLDITAITTETVTVGADGAAGISNGDGGDGGTSSFGSHNSATGGKGGKAGGVANSGRGGSGGVGTGSDIDASGDPGGSGAYTDSISGGRGGSGPYGGGGNTETVPGAGQAGAGYGSGGSGGVYDPAAGGTMYVGGAGTKGIVVVKEYR